MTEKIKLNFTWKEKEYFTVIKHTSNGFYRVELYDNSGWRRKQLNENDEGLFYYLVGVESMLERTMWKYEGKWKLLNIG